MVFLDLFIKKRDLSLELVITEVIIIDLWGFRQLETKELGINSFESKVIQTNRPFRITFVVENSLRLKCHSVC
jgi:hypothetical protein